MRRTGSASASASRSNLLGSRKVYILYRVKYFTLGKLMYQNLLKVFLAA